MICACPVLYIHLSGCLGWIVREIAGIHYLQESAVSVFDCNFVATELDTYLMDKLSNFPLSIMTLLGLEVPLLGSTVEV